VLACRRQHIHTPQLLHAPSILQSFMTAVLRTCAAPRCAACMHAAGFPVLVIHGRNDKLASAANAEALARQLHAPCVIL
jgi:pimeloyl-ACP methyl ester carboxylesterase